MEAEADTHSQTLGRVIGTPHNRVGYAGAGGAKDTTRTHPQNQLSRVCRSWQRLKQQSQTLLPLTVRVGEPLTPSPPPSCDPFPPTELPYPTLIWVRVCAWFYCNSLCSVGIPFLREMEKVWIWGRGKMWGALGRVEGGETAVRL